MFFWNSLAFSMIQWILAIWSLVPLPFLKAAWTSGSHGSRIADTINMCVGMCVCVCVYIYIYRERERDNWIIVVQQKLTQHCKSTILQLNKFFKKAMQWLPWLSGHQVQWQEQLQSAEYRPCFFLPPTTGGREQLKMKRTRGGCSELSSEDSGPCEGKRQLHLWGSYKMFTNVVLV